MTAARGEAGSATVWVLVASVVVAAAGVVVVGISAAVQARHRAAGSADAAALAAAIDAAGPDPCGAARDVAARDGAELVACTLRDGVALVRTRVALGPGLSWAGAVAGVARAGPGDPEPPADPARQADHAHGPRRAHPPEPG